MAEDYNKTLELFKRLQESGTNDVATNVIPSQKRSDSIQGNVDFLNEAVFGKYTPTEEDIKKNDSKVLVETMKEYASGNVSDETRARVEENIRNSKMPMAILNEMISNPLIDTNVGNSDIEDFIEKKVKKNTNIEASNRIIKKLDESATKTVTSTPQKSTANNISIDYQKLQETIETIIENKFNSLISRMPLNENRNYEAPSIKAIQEKDGGRFLMVDTDNNVFECTLTYKGKNKKK